MDNLEFIEQTPEFYDVIPEFNSEGRLCNYHTGGDGETVRVMADEWERFNQLAGRQHEIVDGIVVYNADLEPCMPDDTSVPTTNERLDELILTLFGFFYEMEVTEEADISSDAFARLVQTAQLGDITVTKLRSFAASENVGLKGITRKADIITAIENAEEAAT